MLKSGKRKWSAKQGKLVKPADKLQVNKSYKEVVMKRALSLASEVPMYLKKFLARFVGLTVANVVSAAKIRFAQGWVNRSQNPQFREVPMFSIMKKLFASIARLNLAGSLSAAKMQPLLLTFTLMVATLGVSSAVAAEKEMVKDPSTGKMVEKPRYGGSLTFVRRNEGSGVDAWSCCFWMASAVVEKLSIVDWAIDREKYPFMTGYVPPLFAQRPALAESWEQPDPLTYVFHIRPGVRWHDKAPMNGRALTAKDVEYNYHRLLGMGKFTEKSPSAGALGALPFESIEATDDMTVVFKLTEPRVPSCPADHAVVLLGHTAARGDRGKGRDRQLAGPGRHRTLHDGRLGQRQLVHLREEPGLLGVRREVPGEPTALYRQGHGSGDAGGADHPGGSAIRPG